MTNLIFDPPRDDEAWRKIIYDGDIIILSPTPEMLALVEHTRGMIEDTFAPLIRNVRTRAWLSSGALRFFRCSSRVIFITPEQKSSYNAS
jgi:hypothetical protein